MGEDTWRIWVDFWSLHGYLATVDAVLTAVEVRSLQCAIWLFSCQACETLKVLNARLAEIVKIRVLLIGVTRQYGLFSRT